MSKHFYTFAIMDDAAVDKLAELPIQKKAKSKFVFAMLEGRTQDLPVMDPDYIIMAALQDGFFFLAEIPLKEKFGILPKCASLAKEETIEQYQDCFVQNVTQHPAYSQALHQAQAIYEHLPTLQ